LFPLDDEKLTTGSDATNISCRRSAASSYSKDLETHKHAVALHFGVYNFVRQHHTLGTTPAVAAGLEEKPWSLERVVEMTADYMRQRNGAPL